MEDLEMDENYWNFYNFKMDINEVFEKKENEIESKTNFLDDTDINYNKQEEEKKKKKRRHRKRKRKEMEEECEEFPKSKSVEPNCKDNGNHDSILNESSTEHEDIDLIANNVKLKSMQDELNQKMKLWTDFVPKENEMKESKKNENEQQKKKRKISHPKVTKKFFGYGFKNKDNLDNFRNRNLDLNKRKEERNQNEKKNKGNKKNKTQNSKDDKYKKMNQIRKDHHRDRLNGKQFKLDRNRNLNNKSEHHHRKKFGKGNKNGKGKNHQQQKRYQQKQQQQSNMTAEKEQSSKSYNTNNKNTKHSYDEIDIDQEINNLQETQFHQLNNMDGNGNNMYLNDNPTFHSYRPRNGNHFNRSHMLSKPSSFVPGHMANDVNDFERSIPLPFDRGGNNNTKYFQNGGKFYQNQNRNNYDYNHGFDYSHHPDHSNGYNRHTNINNYSRASRFEPTGHNPNLDYGFDHLSH